MRMATMTAGLHEVTAAELGQWLQQGAATVLDVRSPDEHRRERIAGAALAPAGTLDAARIAAEGRRVVLQCNSGARSFQAAQALLAAGAKEIWHLQGGLQAWKRAGLPLTGDPAAPLPIMRQVQIIAGSLIVLGFVLGAMVNPAWHLLSGFVGAGLTFAGLTGRCGMATLLARLPYNRRGAALAEPAPRSCSGGSCCA
jgi:rhodanese-related sulfurtransferase